MPRIPAILSLGLLTGCAAAAPPTAQTAPPPVTFFRAVPTKARFQPPPPSKLSFDPVEDERAREQEKEEQEDVALREAMRLFQEFVDLAGNAPEYAEAVKRSQERIADIKEILRFREEGRLARGRSGRGE